MKVKRLVIYSSIAILLSSQVVLTNCYKDNEIQKHSISIHHDDIHLIGHRGLSSIYLDNTLSSVSACYDNNCIDGIEIDVRLTKDNQVILMHDEKILDRDINEYTLDELREIDLIYSSDKMRKSISKINIISTNSGVVLKRFLLKNEDDNKVCTLSEVLENRDSEKELLVELKFDEGNEDILIDSVAELLSNQDNIIIQSFDSNNLMKMKSKYPNFKYQVIISKKKDLNLLDKDFDGYAIKYTLADEEIIKNKIDEGKSICFWTIDDYSTFVDLYKEYENNVSYISDIPDIICYSYTKKGIN